MVIIDRRRRFCRLQKLLLLAAFVPALVATDKAFSEIPRGVFCLLPSSTGGAGKDPAVYTDPNVDGISVREKWCELEPTEGNFDWAFLDTVISKAAAGGKEVLLRIGTSGGDAALGGNCPSWVINAVDAEALPTSQKFFTFDNSGTPATIAVFWDPVYLAKKKAMIAALGARYSNNPAVKIVAASFANAQSEDWGVPHTGIDVANWFAAGYTTEKLLDAGRQIVDATMAAFPYQYVTVAIGSNGHVGGTGNLDPDENYVARNVILAARASWPGRLIVQKNTLAAFSPQAPGTGTQYGLLWDSAPDIAGQMLWSCYDDATYRMNDGVAIDPSAALRKSVDRGAAYGMKYVEIYRVDILNLPAATQYAHNALTAPTPIPSPTPTPTATPTPNVTPTPTATPTPTPTPTGTWCDLRISVTDGNTAILAGQIATHTIVVTNTGPYDVVDALVSDNFPATFTGVTFTATQSGGASGFKATGTGNINDTVTIPVGGFVTYKATGQISSSATDTLSNTATVATPSGVTDSNLANNSATDTNAISLKADAKVTITDGNSSAFVGQKSTYTIVVTNSGPSDMIGARVSDIFPNTFTGVTFTATQSGGASGFSASGNGNINDTVRLPTGSRITYKAKGTISSLTPGTLSNTATVTAPSGLLDPILSNNSATDSESFTLQADLKVTVADGKTTALVGKENTYTIIVTNSGPSDVIGAILRDSFPGAFNGVTFTATQSGGASGFSATGTGNINATVTLPAGSQITYKAKGTISSSATGTLSNTATAAAPSGVPDPVAANNSATDIDQL